MTTDHPRDAGDTAVRRTLAALHEAHVERLGAIDPLLRVGEPPADGEVLLADGAGGVARTTEQDMLWATRRTHVLSLRLAHDDADAGAVLDAWLARVATDPAAGDDETSAVLTAASRDVAVGAAAVRRHLAPASVLAVHPFGEDEEAPRAAGRAVPGGPAGVRVRTAAAADLPWLLDRSAALHAWEARLGFVPAARDARASLGAELPEALARDEGWTWVAEVEGRPVGFVQVNPPEPAAWATGATWLAPAGYLVGAYVDPAHRAGGLGRVLVDAAHARAREEGWSALVLHHSGVSAWSAPFWAARGYRPLLTSWMRRPAVL